MLILLRPPIVIVEKKPAINAFCKSGFVIFIIQIFNAFAIVLNGNNKHSFLENIFFI